MLPLYLVLTGFSHLGWSSFRTISHFLAPTKRVFLLRSAQNGESLRPSPGGEANSETGDISAFRVPEEQSPTVKRVRGGRSLPPGLRRV